MLLPKDYVRLRLTGERATDVADASGTLLLDVGARAWSDRLCAAFGVDPAWLPPVLESAGGQRRRRRPACPSRPAPATRRRARWASGVLDGAGPASIVLGTSGVVFAARDAYAPDPRGRLHAFCHAVPGHVARDGRRAVGGGRAALAARRDDRADGAPSTR